MVMKLISITEKEVCGNVLNVKNIKLEKNYMLCRHYIPENKRCKVLLADNFEDYRKFVCVTPEKFKNCGNFSLHKQQLRIKLKRKL